MARWRLLLEEFYPKVLHVSSEKKSGTDCFSRNQIKQMAFDVIEWEPLMERWRYCDFDDKENEFFYPFAARAKKEAESKFPLSMHWMVKDQMDNDDFNARMNRVENSGSK